MTKKKFKFNPKPPEPTPPPVTLPPPGRKNINESMGFGDTISKLINKMSMGKIKECEPCRKRKEKLNKMLPYKNDN
tara:strand:+ start:438 stop:665 length:228 start_codon:yes stop_codon:yes gene_type:complete